MKQQNKNTGNKGERVAEEKLKQEGYQILDRNYRNKWGEVDLVARCKLKVHQVQETVVVFVEVKTKTEEMYGEPWEMINHHKLKQITNMGHLWCMEHGWKGLCRIDAVGVWIDSMGEVKRTEHWENVEL